MKKFGFITLSLIVLVMLAACSSWSWDTIKYGNGAFPGHAVEIAECSVDAPALPAAKVVNIKEAILFNFDKSNIRKSEEATLDKIASLMKSNPDTALALDGYTCTIGTDAYNASLAQRRVDSVKAALVARGVPTEKITKITSVGETELFSKVKKENRRVMVLSVQ